MTNCEPTCPTFPPSIAGPLAPIVVEWDDAGPTLDVTLYGTLGFSAQIITNPIYDSSAPPLAVINSINIYGNTLNIVFNAPSDVAQGYDAVIRVSNVCGTLDIPVHLDVIQPVAPPLTACDTAQALFPLDPRVPALGDSLLAFTPTGCAALLPPNLLDVCAVLQAFPVVAPTPVDTVFGDQGGVCSQYALSDIFALYDLCAALQAFPAAGPLTPADQFPVIQGGVCGLTTLADISANFDICTALQNLPNAVVQPTAVFYGQQAGQCFEFAVSDLLALAVPPCPLLATCDGSCAAPVYSFASQPTSGMWMNGAILTLSTNNCADMIEVGASINITSNSSSIVASAASLLRTASALGAQVDLTSEFDVSIFGSQRLNIDAIGTYRVQGTPGNPGDVLTSQGVGLPSSWSPPTAGVVVSPLTAPGDPEPGLIYWDFEVGPFSQFRRTVSLLNPVNTFGVTAYPRVVATQLYNGPANQHFVDFSIQDNNGAGRSGFIGGSVDAEFAVGGGSGWNVYNFASDQRVSMGVGDTSSIGLQKGLCVVHGGGDNGVTVDEKLISVQYALVPGAIFEIARNEVTAKTKLRLKQFDEHVGVNVAGLGGSPTAANPAKWIRVNYDGIDYVMALWPTV